MLGMVKYHLLLLSRDPLLLALGFGMPFIQLFLSSEMIDIGEGSYHFIDVTLPLYTSIMVMSLCFMDSAYNHAYARDIKFLRRLRLTPVKPAAYLLSGYLFRLAIAVVLIGSFVGIAALVFDLDLSNPNWVGFALMVWLTFTMFYVMGMFVANVFKVAKTAQGALFAVFFGFIFIVNIVTGLGDLPVFIQRIIENMPVVYGINVLQYAWFGMDLFSGHSLIGVIGLTAVFGMLSVKFFKFE